MIREDELQNNHMYVNIDKHDHLHQTHMEGLETWRSLHGESKLKTNNHPIVSYTFTVS